MELSFTADTRISTLQQLFNRTFPFLRLEFFRHPHGNREASPASDRYNTDGPLADAGFNGKQGRVDLKPEMRIADFERLMHDRFGLNIQVFRKSGKLWLETTATDHLSLASQNELGQEHEKPVPAPPRDEIDLNEQP